MFFKFFSILSCLLGFSLFNNLYAHPVSYAGSFAVMGQNSKEESELVLNYSFTSRFSTMAHYMRMDTKEGERNFYMAHANVLLKRWNELKSQGNLYFSLGHGVEDIETSYKNTSSLSLEADWESRKYYVSFKESAYLSHSDSSRNIYLTKLRAGIAPYLADFNELNSWFIVELSTSNKSREDFSITPLIRLFYKNVLLELGANHKGDAQFNYMVHF